MSYFLLRLILGLDAPYMEGIYKVLMSVTLCSGASRASRLSGISRTLSASRTLRRNSTLRLSGRHSIRQLVIDQVSRLCVPLYRISLAVVWL
jgi:hypothetical protein